MTIKNTDKIVGPVTFAVTFIWVVFTGMFLFGFTKIPLLAWFIAIFGSLVFEGFHLWSMIKMKTFWKDKVITLKTITRKDGTTYEKEKVSHKRTPYLVMFILAAAFTVFSAVSFVGRVISEYQAEANDTAYNLVSAKNKIEEFNKSIKSFQDRIDVTKDDTNLILTYNKAVIALSNTQAKRDIAEFNYNTMKSNATEEDLKKTETVNSFQFYQRTFRIPIEAVVIILMLLFFGSLEIGYVLICPEEEKDSPEILKAKENIIIYVEELFNIDPNKKRLNSNEKISKATGLSIHECRRFEDILSGRDAENAITYRVNGNKVPMIEIGQGKRKANFKKEGIIALINNKANLS